jgi:hypothetical protein
MCPIYPIGGADRPCRFRHRIAGPGRCVLRVNVTGGGTSTGVPDPSSGRVGIQIAVAPDTEEQR